MPWRGCTGYHVSAGSWHLQSYLVLGRVLAEASGDPGSILNSVLSSCVIMGKSLNLSEPHFPHLYNSNNNIPC